MDKVTNRKFIYLGFGLGLSRILIGIIVSKLNLDIGYFIDVFIFAYLYLWPLFTKQIFSFKYIVLINILIASIAIVINDLFLLLKHPANLNLFYINRGIVALNILIISFLSSVFYFFTRRTGNYKSK